MSLKAKFLTVGILSIAVIALAIAAEVITSQMSNRESEVNKNRYLSFVIAKEFTQVSQDLTRTCRTYVSTGNQKYYDQYLNLVDWQAGKIPRPDYVNEAFYRGEKNHSRKS